MKRLYILVSIMVVLSLCACGAKTQPTPTAAPTAVPTEAPAVETPAEASAEEAEPEKEAFDPNSPGSVLNYYGARGSEMFGSYAFMQLDTEGKKTWTAPLAGIQEFKVPEAFLYAKGGVQAAGGKELFAGTGIVSIDVVYLPITEADYDAFQDWIAEFVKEHEDPTDEDKAAYDQKVQEYHSNAYHLFTVMGIGNNGTAEDLKTALEQNYRKLGAPEDKLREYLDSIEIFEAGGAENYKFYLLQFGNRSDTFKDNQANYKEEYNAIYDAVGSYAANFTFMHPLALAQLVSEGTGLTFETKDLNDNPVVGSELFGSHNIIADFRRVPTVWSFLTAGKSEDENGKPLPPKISVNVNQPEAGQDKDISMSGSGHTGIGIEYSRYSLVSNRYERYGLKYGFGIADETVSAGILNATKGARTFGQLWDEKNREFDVTRTFPATSKQVNDILKASETWADGGYNLLTRNCTTFVKHLVRDVAHLPVGDQIFQTKVPDLNSAVNFLGFAGVASETNAKLGMESSFTKLAGQEDLSYAGFGNKRATKKDYKIYKDSLDPDATWDNEADLPNGAAENMRRMEGPDSGILSSSGYISEKL